MATVWQRGTFWADIDIDSSIFFFFIHLIATVFHLEENKKTKGTPFSTFLYPSLIGFLSRNESSKYLSKNVIWHTSPLVSTTNKMKAEEKKVEEEERKKKEPFSISLCESASGACPMQLLSQCDWLSQKEQAGLWRSLSGTRLFPPRMTHWHQHSARRNTHRQRKEEMVWSDSG